ncbi:ATP-binding protein [Candidatus Woesearchaeota archaeon]|nr:ATP-binding protein [Candidatus Woesearchaeota archaeon]
MISQDKLTVPDPFPTILGQGVAKQQLASALLVGRHVVIIGPPGIGKTTLAKNVAKLLPSMMANDCPYHCSPSSPLCPSCRIKAPKQVSVAGHERFVRVQGSPDLTVEDLFGDIDPAKALQFGPFSMQAFTPGKMFKANNGVLFFDELNRCPEKLQNALLQVLEEGYATIGSYDVDIPAQFIFIATMNPDDATTEKISDVLLDRFDVVRMTYPEDTAVESLIVARHGKSLGPVVSDTILQSIVRFVRLLRENDKVEKKPSVRASIGLYERSQAYALLQQRSFVEWKDVEAVAASVLAHRMTLKPSVQYIQSPYDLVNEELSKFTRENQPGAHPDHEKGDDP